MWSARINSIAASLMRVFYSVYRIWFLVLVECSSLIVHIHGVVIRQSFIDDTRDGAMVASYANFKCLCQLRIIFPVSKEGKAPLSCRSYVVA